MELPEPVFDARIREKGGGVLEGSPLGTADKEAKQRGVGIRDYRPEGGESWLDVQARARDFLMEVVNRHLSTSPPVKLLIVSHGGCIMELLNVIRMLKHQPSIHANIAKNTALYLFRVSRKSGNPSFTEVLSNDTAHLS